MPPLPKRAEYRPEIDGLRAIAVSTVVVNHALPSALRGGFIGVDIFYVISGYLITTIISRNLAAGRFSFSDFYARRVRRIFPALVVVLLVTTLFAVRLLPPRELASYGDSLLASFLFSSNFFFWKTSGYFAPTAHSLPLLHTWSLAIEEQFYIFFPFLLWTLRRWRHVQYFLLVLLALSLVYSGLTVRRHPDTAFYLLPARAWELLVGAALSYRLVALPTNRWVREGAAVLGLASILGSAALLTSTSVFPGPNALFPCVGAALVILSGGPSHQTLVGRILSLRPFVFIGAISYSLYLWHWPVISLLHVAFDEFSVRIAVLAVLVSVLLSILSWWFVERPFHNHPSHIADRRVILADRPALMAALSVVVVGVATGVALKLMTSPLLIAHFYSKEVVDLDRVAYRVPTPGGCQAVGAAASLPDCRLGPSQTSARIAIWGDSIADALKDGLVEAQPNLSFYRFIFHSCPPILGVRRVDERPGFKNLPGRCTQFNSDVAHLLSERGDIRTVVVAGNFVWAQEVPGAPLRLVPEVQESGAGSRTVLIAEEVANTVNRLVEAGKTVVLIGAYYSTADIGATVLLRKAMRGERPSAVMDLATYDAYSKEMNDVVRRRLDRRVVFVDPRSVFCDVAAKTCDFAPNGVPLILDDVHFTIEGARRITQQIERATNLSTASD